MTLVDARYNNGARNLGQYRQSGLYLIDPDAPGASGQVDITYNYDQILMANAYEDFDVSHAYSYYDENAAAVDSGTTYLDFKSAVTATSTRGEYAVINMEDPGQDLSLAFNRYDGIDTRIKRYLTANFPGGLNLDEDSLVVKSRNYIPVVSIDGTSFYDNNKICQQDGTKKPVRFLEEMRRLYTLNSSHYAHQGVQDTDRTQHKVKSLCINDWAAIGRHNKRFTITRWEAVKRLMPDDTSKTLWNDTTAKQNFILANLDGYESTAWTLGNIDTSSQYLLIDPNKSNGLVDIASRGVETYNTTDFPAYLITPNDAPPPGSADNMLNAVSYTHLTLPTIYSV